MTATITEAKMLRSTCDDNESTEDCLLFLQDLLIRKNASWVAVSLFQFVWPVYVIGILRVDSNYPPPLIAFGLVFLGNAVVLALWHQYLLQGDWTIGLVFVFYCCAPTMLWLLGCFGFFQSPDHPLKFVVHASSVFWFFVLFVRSGCVFVRSGCVAVPSLIRRVFRQMEDRYFAELAACEEQEQQQLEAQQERLELILESSRNSNKPPKRRQSSDYRLLLIVLLGLSVLWQVFSTSPIGVIERDVKALYAPSRKQAITAKETGH